MRPAGARRWGPHPDLRPERVHHGAAFVGDAVAGDLHRDDVGVALRVEAAGAEVLDQVWARAAGRASAVECAIAVHEDRGAARVAALGLERDVARPS